MNLTDRLEELTQAREWLDSYRPLREDIRAELAQRFEVRLTHHSTAIEGNTLTQSETQIVLEKGVTIGGKSVKDHLEVIGHRDAIQWLREIADDEPLTERTIRELHSLVMRGQDSPDSGAYRRLDVMAAGTEHRYPSYLHVPQMMAEFIEWFNTPGTDHPVIKASETHLQFVTIHPFSDGNGRLGRLLLNLSLMRSGFPIAVIPVSRRVEYIAALVENQTTGDPGAIHRIVIDAVEASLIETLELCSGALGFRDNTGLEAWLSR